MAKLDPQKPIVDFTIVTAPKRKKMLFYKRPKGTPTPVGLIWRCICGADNTFIGSTFQFCQSCSCKICLQENAEDKSQYSTCVIVAHFDITKPFDGPR